jgi:hypothetical protein
MSRVRSDALRFFLLAVLFYAFFDLSKHVNSVAEVNPFAEDPYDAVGSFAVQLALFLAFLTGLRTFRPYPHAIPIAEYQVLIARGRLLGASAIVLTLAGDIVAMARHVALWMSSGAGVGLAATTILLLFLSAFEAWSSWPAATAPQHLRSRTASVAAVGSAIAAASLLVVYPEALRQSLAGELLTALAGMSVLFLPLGVIARISAKGHIRSPFPRFDVVDDVVAVCEFIKTRSSRLSRLYFALDRIQHATWLRRVFAWVNPKRYRWRLCMVTGVLFGLALVAAELSSDSRPNYGKALLVVSVFVGLESIGLALGYGLLGAPLQIFRRNEEET